MLLFSFFSNENHYISLESSNMYGEVIFNGTSHVKKEIRVIGLNYFVYVLLEEDEQ